MSSLSTSTLLSWCRRRLIAEAKMNERNLEAERLSAICDRLEKAEPAAVYVQALTKQTSWSKDTFGPGLRTKMVVDHIRKELLEIEENPTDLEEWIDVMMLAFDGAWRCGYTPEEVMQAYRDKLRKNTTERKWPDWRTYNPDEAIEHIKEEE